ncbi:MAG: type IV pilin [Methanosarcinaceae archaeon]|nr:type IV pilin [Methanosarcinaceae archaeon]
MSKILPRRFKNNDNAIAPIIGALLITLLTIVLASLTAVTLYDSNAVQSLRNAFGGTPTAVIEIENVEGSLHVTPFDKTYIRLVHKSGDSLILNSTSIVLYGEGGAFVGFFGEPGSHTEKGNLVVKYVDIGYADKNIIFTQNNPLLDDNLWSTGEQIILWGRDSSTGNGSSSVLATINGITSTYNNYGFKADTIVTVKVFDEKSDCIIAEDTAFVHLAE